MSSLASCPHTPTLPCLLPPTGVGLSVGYTKLCSVIVLNSNWAVRQVSKGLMVGGHDGNMPVEYNLASGSTQGEIDTAGSKTHRTLKLGSPMNNDLVSWLLFCQSAGSWLKAHVSTNTLSCTVLCKRYDLLLSLNIRCMSLMHRPTSGPRHCPDSDCCT